MDPKIPGAVDGIINLGDFWNEEGIRKNRKEIENASAEISRIFERAYRYLKAAASIYEDTSAIYNLAENIGKFNTVANDIEYSLFKGMDISQEEGRQRSLFASAITPEGLKNHLDTIVTTSRVYALKCAEGKSGEKLLNRIVRAAIERGLDVECFYCAFNPAKVEHIVIPGLEVSFTTSNAYHNLSSNIYMTLDLNEYTDGNILEKYQEIIEYNRTEFDMLLERAIYTIGKAKALHDELESYYVTNMDFEAVQRCWEMTLAKILEFDICDSDH